MTHEEKVSYIERRNLIVEILTSLKGYWDLAPGLLAFMESMHITPEVIDGLEKILKDAINQANTENSKEKIQAGLDRISTMKALEAQERKKEQEKLQSIGFMDIP